MANDKDNNAPAEGWDAPVDDGDFFRDLEASQPASAPTSPPPAGDGDGDAGANGGGAAREGLFGEATAAAEPETEDGGEGLSEATVLRFLEEKGLLGQSPEGDEDGEGDGDASLEDRLDRAVEGRIAELFGELPEAVRQLNRFVMNGGDFGEFIARASKGHGGGLTEDMDLGEEDAQEAVLRHALAEEGNDDEEVEAQLEFLRDSGRLESMARKKHKKWLERQREVQAQLAERQAEQRRQEREQAREQRRRIAALLEEDGGLGMLPVGREDRKSVPAYMGERTVELDNGTRITAMQRDLFYELPKNERALAQLALLLRNRNADGTFNFDGIARVAETKVSREVKASMRRTKDVQPHRSKEGGHGSRSLADYFG